MTPQIDDLADAPYRWRCGTHVFNVYRTFQARSGNAMLVEKLDVPSFACANVDDCLILKVRQQRLSQ